MQLNIQLSKSAFFMNFSHHRWHINLPERKLLNRDLWITSRASDQKIALDKMFLELNFGEGLFFTKMIYY